MYLKKSEIVVIKIGSSLLIDDKMNIRHKWLTEFSKDIRDLIKKKKKNNFSKLWSHCIRL